MNNYDELCELIKFFKVLTLLKLAPTNSMFYKAYLKHKGRHVIVGKLHHVYFYKNFYKIEKKFFTSYKQVNFSEEFYPPPDDITFIKDITFYRQVFKKFPKVFCIYVIKIKLSLGSHSICSPNSTSIS
jgi:hypothetical protein